VLTHVVMFRLRDGADVDGIIARLEGLREQVTVLRDLEVGRNVIDSPRAYDVCVVARLDDHDALAAYQDDPAHLEVVETLRPDIAAAAAVDYVGAV
jgi:hypothetical protein